MIHADYDRRSLYISQDALAAVIDIWGQLILIIVNLDTTLGIVSFDCKEGTIDGIVSDVNISPGRAILRM